MAEEDDDEFDRDEEQDQIPSSRDLRRDRPYKIQWNQ